MYKRYRFCTEWILIALSLMMGVGTAFGLDPRPDALFIRIFDVGQGLSAVAVAPGGHYLVYDAGEGNRAIAKIREIIPQDAAIDFLVLSHSDADHLGAAAEICAAYTIREIVHSGNRRDTQVWRETDAAIRREAAEEGCRVINLAETPLQEGTSEALGDARLTWIFGLSEPSEAWVREYHLSESERKNVGSIVVRLSYREKSILFCGDSVGRHIGDPDDSCIAAERAMVDRADSIPILADILVAPHHGADNAGSLAFIRAVRPTYVIFAAGHKPAFQHPRTTAVRRYLSTGIPAERLLRTDLGDDDGPLEWAGGRITGYRDPAGDDDVDVLLPATGDPVAAYRNH